MRTFFVCTILIFCCSLLFGQKYETSFYGEDTLKNLIPIPDEIMNVLKQDETVKRCFGSDAQTQKLRLWFEATKINLNNDNVAEILVKATDDIQKSESNCLNGNAISFWIFRKSQNDYDLVLYLYTITVEINKKKSKDFYNINTIRNTGSESFTTFYVFNGKKYIEKGKKVEPLPIK